MQLVHYDVISEDAGLLGVAFKLYRMDLGVPVGDCLFFGFGKDARQMCYNLAGYMIDQQWGENGYRVVVEEHFKRRVMNILMNESILQHHPIYHLINWDWIRPNAEEQTTE